jgi:hypothetical protein
LKYNVIKIERVGTNLFRAFVDVSYGKGMPWQTTEPLSSQELRERLLDIGVHPVDAIEMVAKAASDGKSESEIPRQ